MWTLRISASLMHVGATLVVAQFNHSESGVHKGHTYTKLPSILTKLNPVMIPNSAM